MFVLLFCSSALGDDDDDENKNIFFLGPHRHHLYLDTNSPSPPFFLMDTSFPPFLSHLSSSPALGSFHVEVGHLRAVLVVLHDGVARPELLQERPEVIEGGLEVLLGAADDVVAMGHAHVVKVPVVDDGLHPLAELLRRIGTQLDARALDGRVEEELVGADACEHAEDEVGVRDVHDGVVHVEGAGGRDEDPDGVEMVPVFRQGVGELGASRDAHEDVGLPLPEVVTDVSLPRDRRLNAQMARGPIVRDVGVRLMEAGEGQRVERMGGHHRLDVLPSVRERVDLLLEAVFERNRVDDQVLAAERQRLLLVCQRGGEKEGKRKRGWTNLLSLAMDMCVPISRTFLTLNSARMFQKLSPMAVRRGPCGELPMLNVASSFSRLKPRRQFPT